MANHSVLGMLSNILLRADPFSLREGNEYFEARKVSDIKYSPHKITSNVSGTQVYQTELFYDEHSGAGFLCNCHSYRSPCKHVVATLLSAQKERSKKTTEILNKKIPHYYLQISKMEKGNLQLKVFTKVGAGYKDVTNTLDAKDNLHSFLSSLSIKADYLEKYSIVPVESFIKIFQALQKAGQFHFAQLLTPSEKPLLLEESKKKLILSLKNERNGRLSLNLRIHGQLISINPNDFLTVSYNYDFSSSASDGIENMVNYSFENLEKEEDSEVSIFKDPDHLEKASQDPVKGMYFSTEGVLLLPHSPLVHYFSDVEQGGFAHSLLVNEARGIFEKEYILEGFDENPATAIIPITPKPVIVLSEDRFKKNEAILKVSISFDYGNWIVDSNARADIFVSKGKPVKRDNKFERSVAKKVFGNTNKNAQLFQFDEALNFLFEKLPTFSSDWKIKKDLSFYDFRSDLHFKASLKESDSSNWFDFKFEVPKDLKKTLSKKIIQEILRKKPKYIMNKEGKWIHLSDELRDSISIAYFIGSSFLGTSKEGTQISAFQVMGMWRHLQEIKSLEIPPVVEETIAKLKAFMGIKEIIPSNETERLLRNYQKEGVSWLEFLHDHNLSGVLCDDMGLGKTLQTLVFLKRLKQKSGMGQCVVVAPTSAVGSWLAEIKKFTPDFKVKVIDGNDRGPIYEKFTDNELYLTSYAIFTRDIEQIRALNIKYLILDEAQFIKNQNSKRARALFSANSERRLVLTGTPLENRLSDLWSIFHFVMPGYLGSTEYFKDMYQNPVEKDGDMLSLGILKDKIKPFMLRRLKGEVEKELPLKTEIPIFCDMTEDQKKVYLHTLDLVRKDIFDKIDNKGLQNSYIHIFSALTKLRQICDHPGLVFDKKFDNMMSGKFEAFKEILQEAVDENHSVLVFSQFTSMLSYIKKWLNEQKIEYLYLDGATKNRQELVETFQHGKHPVFLLSLKAGGTALTLTKADYVMHFDPWWNPAVENQATDRAHRIGQSKNVFVYKFYCRGTIEEKILNLQKDKQRLFDNIMEDSLNSPHKLTKQDIEEILSPEFA